MLILIVLIGVFQSSLLAQGTTSTKAEATEEIQICDLFRRLDEFSGKRVAVRGVYRFARELAGLYGEGCQQPLLLDGVERAIALHTQFVGKALDQRADFARFSDAVAGVAGSGRRQAIHVTFVGIVLTRNPELHKVGQRSGERMFGHLGVYPAELRWDAVRNTVIVEDSSEPSNMNLRK